MSLRYGTQAQRHDQMLLVGLQVGALLVGNGAGNVARRFPSIVLLLLSIIFFTVFLSGNAR